MKRLLLLAFLCVAMLCSCNRYNDKVVIDDYYTVTETNSGLTFSVYFDGTTVSAKVIAPKSIQGLTIKSSDGVSYIIDYMELSTQSSSLGAAPIRDFISSLNLLKECGSKNKSYWQASVDTINVKAEIYENSIKTIEYNNNGNTKFFLINGDD